MLVRGSEGEIEPGRSSVKVQMVMSRNYAQVPMSRRNWYMVARYCLQIANRERRYAKGADDGQVRLQWAWKALFWWERGRVG
jgi:hypothetical protein